MHRLNARPMNVNGIDVATERKGNRAARDSQRLVAP